MNNEAILSFLAEHPEACANEVFEESTNEYLYRIAKYRDTCGLKWQDVADIIEFETGTKLSADNCRKRYAYYMTYIHNPADDISEPSPTQLDLFDATAESADFIESQKDKVKLYDVMNECRAAAHRISREETINEIAQMAYSKMQSFIPLRYEPTNDFCKVNGNEMIIMLSDWHYGMEVNNAFNKFNTSICKERVTRFLEQCIKTIRIHPISKIHLVNLADLIAGRIHATIRLQSRIDTITQIMEASEIICEFISILINETQIPVKFYSCIDNHSRLEPNKNNSLELESLARITPWYVISRCKEYLYTDMLDVITNRYGEDIISFESLGWKIGGVHGDKDRQASVVSNLTMLTHQNYDLVLTAHNHHFACDECNNTVVVSNGTLMGTDDYSAKLRLSSTPSQNIIIVSKENVVEDIKRVTLD